MIGQLITVPKSWGVLDRCLPLVRGGTPLVVVVGVSSSSLLGCNAGGWSSTFSKIRPLGGLTIREDGFDKDAHAAAGRVDSAHHAEAKPLLPRSLLKLHIVDTGPKKRVAILIVKTKISFLCYPALKK